jgi:hypothetical protein
MKPRRKFYEPKHDVLRDLQTAQSRLCLHCQQPLPDRAYPNQVFCSLQCEKQDDGTHKPENPKRGKPWSFGRKAARQR